MFVLRGSQNLQILYESLEKNIPESLKVYGAIFNIKNKNPFNMEVLVDAWPDYQMVITRPQKEEMKDDLDHYTNTYHIFTKAPDKLEEVLACPQVINWEQVFQIQGCQGTLGEAIRKISASKSVQVDYLKTALFRLETPRKHKTSSDEKMELTELFKMHKVDEDKKKGNSLNIFLDPSHAGLVNQQWEFGKNERSLKYIERCLQNFPGFGVLGPEGQPISWLVMEQSCELRMGYTVPKYRGQGNMWQIGCQLEKYFFQKKSPIYLHVADNKEKVQDIAKGFGLMVSPCGWHQWKCTPEKYC
ncbi:glycine N-acyltransferase-like protein 2 isoform X1 [Cynocephalus volans]|uniref:glycine N-acyltransferase-like protein 2 isoform X1 n=1 Tax=Cynocephalus volans TaxID=110931 RepID=UPI002FC82142